MNTSSISQKEKNPVKHTGEVNQNNNFGSYEISHAESKNRVNTVTSDSESTGIFDRKADSDMGFVIEILQKKSIDKFTESYSKNQAIEISNNFDLECFHSLIESKVIALEKIESLTLAYNLTVSKEDNKKITDEIMSFLIQHENEFHNLNTLAIQKLYSGHLVIPSWNIKLQSLEIGEVSGALTIESQPSLKDISITKVDNILKIEEQKELTELYIYCFAQSDIAIQPKLKNLEIKVCHEDFSIVEQPSIEQIKIKRSWGMLTMTKEQRKLLTKNPSKGRGMILIEKTKAELEKPLPISRLFTLHYLRNVISVNTYYYLTVALCELLRRPNLLNYAVQLVSDYKYLLDNAALQEIYKFSYQFIVELKSQALIETIFNISKLIISELLSLIMENSTLFYMGLGILCLRNIVNESKRIYDFEKAMMYFD